MAAQEDIANAGKNAVIQLGNIAQALANAFVVQGSGTFTLAAASSTTVNNGAVQSTSRIMIFPTNASAATLQGSSQSLYVSAKNAGVGFTVATADGTSAAGTEVMDYAIINLN